MENDALFTKYKKISYQDRLRLIDKVCQQNIDCKLVAKEMGISFSTAKMIVKNYKEGGRIFERKEEQSKRKILEEFKKNLQVPPVPQQSATVQEPTPVFFYMAYQGIDQLMYPQFPNIMPQYYWPH